MDGAPFSLGILCSPDSCESLLVSLCMAQGGSSESRDRISKFGGSIPTPVLPFLKTSIRYPLEFFRGVPMNSKGGKDLASIKSILPDDSSLDEKLPCRK